MNADLTNAIEVARYHGVHYYRRELAEVAAAGWPESRIEELHTSTRKRWVVVMPVKNGKCGVVVSKQGGMGFFDSTDPLRGRRVAL